ncbi:MAG: nucleotidyltransferase [Oscillospiraceae bacterium]
MTIFSTVCEYNPFHKGHKYHLSQTKKDDNDGLVAVMSGNFVERCESAVLDKRTRAKMALLNGADLILELPLPYATASAETFAFRSVEILNSLGCVDFLSFGSESGDINALCKTADILLSDEINDEIVNELKSGISYPTARENAVKMLFGKEFSSVLKEPNNILGIEYLKALKKLNSAILPMTIKRIGASHDSKDEENGFVSASAIRSKILNKADISQLLPYECVEIFKGAVESEIAPCDFKKLEGAMIASLRMKTADDFLKIQDVSEGLENRLFGSIRKSNTLLEIYDNAKTKRYTHSRIRRILLCSFLGITKDFFEEKLPYIRVLGFNQKGKEILKKAKSTSTVPIIMSASDVNNLNDFGKRLYLLECTSTDIFNLTLPKIRNCGTDMTDNLVIFE